MRLSVSSKPVPVFFLDRGHPRLYSSEPLTAAALTPATKCRLEYLNEGGANIIFRILPAPGSSEPLPPRLQRKLLRVRKDVPHAPSAEDTLTALERNFAPLFPREHLVHHELITLDAGVLALLNDTLASLVRPRHRAGDFLPQEELGALLITDMSVGTATPSSGDSSSSISISIGSSSNNNNSNPTPSSPSIGGGDVLVQLKPKWLTQSPNAPPNATRCRTCAIRAQRAAAATQPGSINTSITPTDLQHTCPLDLVHAVPEERRRALAVLTPDRRVREWLGGPQGQTLLQLLRAHQLRFDDTGTLRTSGTDAIFALCKAMTLRDCTLYVRRAGDVVDARLGDLDLKLPQRLPRWKRVEAELIRDGWYTNTEPAPVWTRERICLLSR